MRARSRNDVKTIAATTGRRSSTECVEGRRIPITPKVRRVVTTLAPIPSPRTRSVYPRRVAWYAAAMSGNAAPRATTVIPTNQGLRPAIAEDDLARGLDRPQEGARADDEGDRHDRGGERVPEGDVRASLFRGDPAHEEFREGGERRDEQRADDEPASADPSRDAGRIVRDEFRALIQEDEAGGNRCRR